MTFTFSLVRHGIANRFPGERIELHEKLFLPEYRDLLIEIVDHEMKHTDAGYSRKDFFLDLKGFEHKRLYWKFLLTTPSAWLQLAPIYRSQGRWFVDTTLCVFWGAVAVYFSLMAVIVL